jgi:hypothetical protein
MCKHHAALFSTLLPPNILLLLNKYISTNIYGGTSPRKYEYLNFSNFFLNKIFENLLGPLFRVVLNPGASAPSFNTLLWLGA